MLLERPCTICKTRATCTTFTSCTNCTTYTICTTCTWADFQVPVAWRCYWWTPPVHSEPLEAAQPNPWNKEILLWRSISINRPFSYSLILLSDWFTDSLMFTLRTSRHRDPIVCYVSIIWFPNFLWTDRNGETITVDGEDVEKDEVGGGAVGLVSVTAAILFHCQRSEIMVQ